MATNPARPRGIAFGAMVTAVGLFVAQGGVTSYLFIALGVLTILRGVNALTRPVPRGESPQQAADRVTRLAQESVTAEVGEREWGSYEVPGRVPDETPVLADQQPADVWVPRPGDLLAPDDLDEVAPTPPGTPEGWYRTADGARERWHNGAGWTAHERAPGTS